MNKSRKRSRAMCEDDECSSVWNNYEQRQPNIKRRREIEYCYTVQIRQTKHGNINQYRWDVVNSYSSSYEANECVIQTLRKIFKVKSQFDIHESKYYKVIDKNSLIRYHDITPPNSNGITMDIWTEKHEVEPIISITHER